MKRNAVVLVVIILMSTLSITSVAEPTVMPPVVIELAPVQTDSMQVKAIAEPASAIPHSEKEELFVTPPGTVVIAPQDGKYGLFELGDDTSLVYGPAELDPKSLAVSWDGDRTILSVKQDDHYKLILLTGGYESVKTVTLTAGPGNDRYPALSPDGRMVPPAFYLCPRVIQTLGLKQSKAGLYCLRAAPIRRVPRRHRLCLSSKAAKPDVRPVALPCRKYGTEILP